MIITSAAYVYETFRIWLRFANFSRRFSHALVCYQHGFYAIPRFTYTRPLPTINSDMKPFTTLILIIFITSLLNAQNNNLTQSLNDFSFDLYGQIKSDKGNLFLSPLSIFYASLIAYEGAKGDTKKEFESVLHIDNPTLLSNFTDFSKNLITWRDSSNYLNISNAIWIQKDFDINVTYQDKIANRYSSDLKTVDFAKKNVAANEINNWVSNKTNGLIKDIISSNEINDFTRIIISNAIYFIGKWADEFNKSLTKPDDFYSINRDKVVIDFMNKTEYLRYYENKDFQFIVKPYKGNDKSFCIILPEKRYALIEFENKFTDSLLDTILNNLDYLEIKLSIPKFKLETNYSLVEPLNKLGLVLAFTPKADFSCITTDEPLMINRVNHKAYIEIDEEKTEATAATIIGMINSSAGGPMPKPKIFKADHPFTFMIIDNKTKGIIFIGRYVQPE